jgi:RND superfamily putative drug exporter
MPTLSTAGLARASAQHPWRVLGIWLLVLVLAGIASRDLTLTNQYTLTNKPESIRADDLLNGRLRPNDPVTETVIVRSSTQTVDDPAFKAKVEQTTDALTAMTGVVSSATNYYQEEARVAPDAAGLVSADRHITLIPVTLTGTIDEAVKHGDAYMNTINGLGGNGFEVLSVGDVSNDHVYGTMVTKDLARGEEIGVPIALLVLIVVFGALVAALLPLALAIVAIVTATGLTALVGHAIELNTIVPEIISMIGLAVGIDYSLFIIGRYREEIRNGLPKQEAISIAGGTASKAVLFSGITVVFALLGMLLVPLNVFRSIGLGAILVVLSALAAMLTLVPAFLRLIGNGIDWPRRSRKDAPSADNSALGAPLGPQDTGGFWGMISRVVLAHPVAFAIIPVILLAALAFPALDLKRGEAGVSTLPPSEVKTAYEILAQDFSAGVISPVAIVVDGKQSDPQVQAAVNSLVQQLQTDSAFDGQPPTVEWDKNGDLALIQATLKSDPNSSPAYAAVKRLRASVIPTTFAGTGAHVYVTGQTAGTVDYLRGVDKAIPLVFVFVLGLSFVLLLLAFRSLVVPAVAIVLNLLSVGAAYGLLVLVFQKGYGDELLGFQRTPEVEAWLPVFLFSILFGLSMDYHVFLLSRIREHYDYTQRNAESVAVGLRRTARIITGAALIMVVVFSSFATGSLVTLQETGFGLAVAILLDATIVRTLLVPAVMKLLGDYNWYLPRWLTWLPDVRIEGAVAPRPAQSPAAAD